MFAQIFLPTDNRSPPAQVEAERDTLSQDVASQKNSRFLWTGLGFACLMLIGLSANALRPLASNANDVAFNPVLPGLFSRRAGQQTAPRNRPSLTMVVTDISSTEEFEKALQNAGDSLVVVDYSTSWCGPCKIIAPKFDALSEDYESVTFLKVMGDSSPEADKLMRSQGVRTLPSFHFWKGNNKVDSVGGAKLDPIKEAIETHK